MCRFKTKYTVIPCTYVHTHTHTHTHTLFCTSIYLQQNLAWPHVCTGQKYTFSNNKHRVNTHDTCVYQAEMHRLHEKAGIRLRCDLFYLAASTSRGVPLQVAFTWFFLSFNKQVCLTSTVTSKVHVICVTRIRHFCWQSDPVKNKTWRWRGASGKQHHAKKKS